jgi:Neurotransmitter-gated ion-channel ligand binding domain/Neurotransmitter-gated ion-channel transmembrane region
MSARTDDKPRLRTVLQTTILLAIFVAAGFILSNAVFPAAAPQEELPADTDKKIVEKVAKEAVEKAAEKAAQKAAEKAVEKAVEKAAEKVVEKAVQQAAGKAAQKAAETAATKAVEKVAEEAAEKAELKTKRPDEWRGPTKVEFLIFIVDIDEIDDAAQNFTANVFIQLRWKDSRYISPDKSPRQIHLEEVWNPRILLANRTGLVSKSLPDVVDVSPDGTVVYRQRYTGKLSQPLMLYDFPLDKHTFTVHFVAAGYTSDDLEFVPDVRNGIRGGTMAGELSLPDWKILKHEALTLPYQPIPSVHTAGFAFRFEAQRYFSYYIWQIVVPLAFIVLMSWVAFWVERDNVGVRIGVATSSILTLIAQRFVLANLLPRLPYMTRLDYFTVGSTLLVFIALMVVVVTSYLAAHTRNVTARRIDLSARAVFPATFFLLLGWFVFG